MTEIMHEFITAESFTLLTLPKDPALLSDTTKLLEPVKWRRYVYAKDLVCINYPLPEWVLINAASSRDRVKKFITRELQDVIMGNGYETWIGDWVTRAFREEGDRSAVEVEIGKIVGRETRGFVERVLVFIGSGLSVEAFDRDARWGERECKDI